MWVFLIPVILLAGATFTGSALQMAAPPPAASAAARPAPASARPQPFNGPLPFDPPYRQR